MKGWTIESYTKYYKKYNKKVNWWNENRELFAQQYYMNLGTKTSAAQYSHDNVIRLQLQQQQQQKQQQQLQQQQQQKQQQQLQEQQQQKQQRDAAEKARKEAEKAKMDAMRLEQENEKKRLEKAAEDKLRMMRLQQENEKKKREEEERKRIAREKDKNKRLETQQTIGNLMTEDMDSYMSYHEDSMLRNITATPPLHHPQLAPLGPFTEFAPPTTSNVDIHQNMFTPIISNQNIQHAQIQDTINDSSDMSEIVGGKRERDGSTTTSNKRKRLDPTMSNLG